MGFPKACSWSYAVCASLTEDWLLLMCRQDISGLRRCYAHHSQTQQGVRNVSLVLFAPDIFVLGTFGAQDDRMGPSSIRQKCSGWNSGPRTCNSDHQGMKTGGGKLCLGAFSHILPLFDPKSKMLVLEGSRGVSGINFWGICASRAYRPLNHIHLKAGGQVEKNGFSIFWFLV